MTLLSALFLREQLTRRTVVAMALALLGTALAVGPASGHGRGILLALAAAGLHALYILAGAHVLKHVSAAQSSTVIFAAAGIMAGVLMLVNQPQLPATSQGWGVIALIVLVAVVVLTQNT